jgi:hypothetical protein
MLHFGGTPDIFAPAALMKFITEGIWGSSIPAIEAWSEVTVPE